TFSGENRFGEQLADFADECFVGVDLGAALVWLRWLQLALPSGVEARPRQVPHQRHPRHTIGLLAGRRNGAAHGFDFQNAKGRPSSRRAIFSRSSSLSTLTLATTDFSRRFSSSSTSTSRLFKTASPPARKRSRHSVSVAAVTRCFREVLSISAPRSSSRTTDTLRLEDHRPPPAVAADSGATSVALRAPSDAPESCFLALDMHFSPLEHFSHQMFPTHCPMKSRAGGQPLGTLQVKSAGDMNSEMATWWGPFPRRDLLVMN